MWKRRGESPRRRSGKSTARLRVRSSEAKGADHLFDRADDRGLFNKLRGRVQIAIDRAVGKQRLDLAAHGGATGGGALAGAPAVEVHAFGGEQERDADDPLRVLDDGAGLAGGEGDRKSVV